MRKKFSRSLFLALLLSLMVLNMIGVFMPQVQAPTLPVDGDAWTENNNATYTWKFHTSYVDTMAWTTSDVHEGTYALNVTHTKASTSMYFRLVLPSNIDVTGYDGLFCWIKATSPDSSFSFEILMNPTDINWDVTNVMETPQNANLGSLNATWTKIFVPLFLFDASGSANLSQVRQIYFSVINVGSADNTEILVDNLHFRDYGVDGQAPTIDQTKMMPLAYYNMKVGQYIETISGTNYTTMRDWQNLTDNTFPTGGLECEILGHNIFALSLAYEETNFAFYLTEAQELARMLLLAQEQNGLGRGGFHNYYTGSVWYKGMGMIFQGWIMAGLSYLYGQTSNATYKTALDLQLNFVCGLMWNDTLNLFNASFDNDTQTVTYATEYNAMREGACTVGLASYYRYVEQNSTALDRLNRALNSAMSTVTYDQRMSYTSGWESDSYQMWGMWQGYQVTSNTTYRDSLLNVSKMHIASYMRHPSLNGSASKQNSETYVWYQGTPVMDGWGLHNSIPLMFLVNEIEAQAYFVNASELSLFNHLRRTQTSEGALQRDSSATYWDRQYYGTPSFVVLGSQLYHLNKATDLYVPASTGRVLNISTTTNTMALSIAGTGTTTTYVYCGSNGEPTTVTGATYSYDASSTVLTLTVTHSSDEEVVIDWTPATYQETRNIIIDRGFIAVGIASVGFIIVVAAALISRKPEEALVAVLFGAALVTVLFVVTVILGSFANI